MILMNRAYRFLVCTLYVYPRASNTAKEALSYRQDYSSSFFTCSVKCGVVWGEKTAHLRHDTKLLLSAIVNT